MPGQSNKKMQPAPDDSVFCLADSSDQVNQIVDRVRTSGFSIGDVSALFPAEDASLASNSKKSGRGHPPQPAAWWTARQSGFANIGALAIPGVGRLVAAGPIIFALYGSIVGAGTSLAGALIGMGISEPQASRYESKIKEGNILVSVHAETRADISTAKTIFRETGAHCICTTD
jgi:hypothetical protein